MTPHHFPLSLALCLLLGTGTAFAQATQLTPAPERITDEAIQTDHDAFRALQGRLHQLNERGVPVRDYHLSKAQCWLDVSLHEYTRNDRSAFPQAAMTESEKLIVALENKATPLPMDTPLVNDAARLRPDLWARTEALKQRAGFKCAWRQVACAEVELVHAGNEHQQQQWRHAKPYVEIAEEWVAQASELIEACQPAPSAPVAVLPAPPVAQPVTWQAQVLFDFDESSAEHMRPGSREALLALLAQVRQQGVTVQSIRLIGHADRLNSTGNKDYNLALSQKRVDTVRQWLQAQGLAVSSMSVQARGASEQVAQCDMPVANAGALQDCLQPNRRVEVEVQGLQLKPRP